jgi:hypothetical protein
MAGMPGMAAPPAGAPAAVQQFLPHVPAGIMCQQEMSMEGGVTHLHCSSGPFTVMYEIFSDGPAANTALAQQSQSVGAAPGNCQTSGPAAIGRFHGQDPTRSIGHLVCFDGPEGTAFSYVLDEFPGVLTTVELPGPPTARGQLLDAWQKDAFGPREPAGAAPGVNSVCTDGEC